MENNEINKIADKLLGTIELNEINSDDLYNLLHTICHRLCHAFVNVIVDEESYTLDSDFTGCDDESDEFIEKLFDEDEETIYKNVSISLC